MTKKQLSILAVMLAVILTVTLIAITTNQAFATSVTNYKVTDDTYTRVTFSFKDGTEVTYFPVFKMTNDMINNEQSSFQLEGIVGDYPYLHEAVQQAYKYRQAAAAIDYDFRQFDVDVDFVKNGSVQKSLVYKDCSITGSSVNTLTDNAEGFTTTKTGFAMVDVIDFACSGLKLKSEQVTIDHTVAYSQNKFTEYPKHSFKMAENVHSIATFTFNEGIEKIDFPVFKITAGFTETSSQRPTFLLQGIPVSHPLLDNAVNKAKQLYGAYSGVANDDFKVDIDFVNDSETFRTLRYTECTIDEYTIDTQTDSEEGYTGKSGFAVTENITISCGGLTTKNSQKESESVNPYIMGGKTYAVATIQLETGEKEMINFPFYKQIFTESHVQTKSKSSKTERYSRLNPTFELQGVHGNYPVLYSVSDLIRTRGMISGTDFQEHFNVSVELKHDNSTVVIHTYSDCRVTNYLATTLYNKEEGYVGTNGFAQVDTVDFECVGYNPTNPAYDALFVVEKAKNESSADLRDTSQWSPKFKYTGKY